MDGVTQKKFIERYAPVHDRFERFCRARVYGDMEYSDLMNETLLVAYQKIGTLREEKAFLSFLFTVAIRLLANSARKRRPDRLNENHEMVDPSQRADTAMAIDELHAALAKLPADQRECLILFEISGFSIKEIMELQNVKESAVKQRLRRGRLRLKELLCEEPALNL